LRLFPYLLGASFCLHLLARLLLMKLFVPSRYVEYSLPLFYCVSSGVILAAAIETAGMKRTAPLLAALLLVLGAVRLEGVGLFDYREQASLYRFLATTPVASVVAGHPEAMDNVPTFARRKVFVSYELSHTWYKRYWATLRRRTDDLFRAYYAADHHTVQRFFERYGIGYMVVRDRDFLPERITSGCAYFQPFGDRIREAATNRNRFAVLDTECFPPVFQQGRIRVIVPASKQSRCSTGPPASNTSVTATPFPVTAEAPI
jgi:hypothetical protein